MSATNPTTGRSTVVGVFRDRDHANKAVDDLRRAGFRDDQIGYAMRGEESRLAGERGERGDEVTTDTGPGSGAATGAMTGGLLGAIAGAAASLLIPGVGPIFAGGILAAALGGAALGAAGGGILGGLITTGVPEEEARYYDEEFRQGGIVVTVQAANRYQEAHDILERHGASFYGAGAAGSRTMSSASSTTSSATRADMGRATSAAGTAGSQTLTDREGTMRVPEVEEKLRVEKRPVQRGEVTIHKEVEEHRETVPVELRREEVHVEKRDVPDRPLRPGEDAFKEGTIRVPVRGEEAVAHKEAVVTGEVVIRKDQTTEHEQISDTVRRTEVHVDQDRQTVQAPRQDVVGASGSASGTAASGDWNTYSTRFRTHWGEHYGSYGGRYEDYEPAYRYGWERANDSQYRGRKWEDLEPDFRRDWETRHRDMPWDRFGDAIRHGWQSLTGAGSRR
jgi:uncharacterized protein (TIGR02271 family)